MNAGARMLLAQFLAHFDGEKTNDRTLLPAVRSRGQAIYSSPEANCRFSRPRSIPRRYPIASAMWLGPSVSAPAMSAMVRATS